MTYPTEKSQHNERPSRNLVLKIEESGPDEFRVYEVHDGDLVEVIAPAGILASLEMIRLYVHWRLFNFDRNPRERLGK